VRARLVWLNIFAEQFLPIVALLALRVVVGIGDSIIRRFTKPKKGAMQARAAQRATAPRSRARCAVRRERAR
jgi:hypothetical protein